MVYPPTGIYLPGIKYKYLGVFTPNPFHNATYMAARPFAILAFFKYGELLPVYEQPNAVREHKRDYILFAIYLLLATMTKPSFTIVLVGAAGILMLWRMFRSRFRNFVPTVWLGAVLWQSAPGYRPGHRIPNPGTSAELQGTAQGQHLPFFLAGVCDELPYGILPV